METLVDSLIKDDNFIDIIKECNDSKSYNSLKLFSKIFNIPYKCDGKKTIKVLCSCNWTSNKDLCQTLNKMSENSNYKWGDIEIIWEPPNNDPKKVDYFCIFNKPCHNFTYDITKTLVFQMEPNMKKHPELWDEFADPSKDKFMFVGNHSESHNNLEWHINKTYKQLKNEPIIKDESLNYSISTILSDRYQDIGQVKRIDFAKFIEHGGVPPLTPIDGGVPPLTPIAVKTLPDAGTSRWLVPDASMGRWPIVDVFGGNKFLWKNYKGTLPYHCKDDGLMPYKYHFNAENNKIPNYFTEKLVDGILSECLVFYCGCPNVREYIDPRAYVQLELSNFEKDYEVIKKAIKDNLWEQRLPFIREAKKKILDEMQFFPRIEKIIKNRNFDTHFQ